MIIQKSTLNKAAFFMFSVSFNFSPLAMADVYNVVDYSTTDIRGLTDPLYGKNLPMLSYLGVANTLSKFDRDVSSCDVAIERLGPSVLRFSIREKGAARIVNALLLNGSEENVAVRYVNSSTWKPYSSVGSHKSLSVTLYMKNKVSGIILTANEDGYVDVNIPELISGQRNVFPTKVSATCSGFDGTTTSFTIPDEMLIALKKGAANSAGN